MTMSRQFYKKLPLEPSDYTFYPDLLSSYHKITKGAKKAKVLAIDPGIKGCMSLPSKIIRYLLFHPMFESIKFVLTVSIEFKPI
jgi:hypothetical protein